MPSCSFVFVQMRVFSVFIYNKGEKGKKIKKKKKIFFNIFVVCRQIQFPVSSFLVEREGDTILKRVLKGRKDEAISGDGGLKMK